MKLLQFYFFQFHILVDTLSLDISFPMHFLLTKILDNLLLLLENKKHIAPFCS